MTDHVHLLAGAYALNALPADERAFFERHLTLCASCSHDVAGYQETAATLGAAAARVPPPALRDRVLVEKAAIRQTARVTVPHRLLRERLQPHLAAVASVLAAALISLAGVLVLLSESDQDATAVVFGPEFIAAAETVRLDAPTDVDATFFYSTAQDAGYLVVDGLGPLDADRDYQLWLFHDGTPVPAGVFNVQAGRTTVQVEAPVRDAELIAVTTEPAGGRSQPSGPVVLSAPL